MCVLYHLCRKAQILWYEWKQRNPCKLRNIAHKPNTWGKIPRFHVFKTQKSGNIGLNVFINQTLYRNDHHRRISLIYSDQASRISPTTPPTTLLTFATVVFRLTQIPADFMDPSKLCFVWLSSVHQWDHWMKLMLHGFLPSCVRRSGKQPTDDRGFLLALPDFLST